MKACLILLLATIALAAITSAANIKEDSHDVVNGGGDTQALVEGQLGWIGGAGNQQGEIRWVPFGLHSSSVHTIPSNFRERGSKYSILEWAKEWALLTISDPLNLAWKQQSSQFNGIWLKYLFQQKIDQTVAQEKEAEEKEAKEEETEEEEEAEEEEEDSSSISSSAAVTPTTGMMTDIELLHLTFELC